ncbi:hypothetical protein ABH972_003936 [Bradyrhizobium ottawaense]
MSAEQLWRDAVRLRSETEIRAWGRESGYGIPFKIYDTRPQSITIYSQSIAKPRSISKKEFLRIAEHWPAYCAGETARGFLGELSQNTSYIFGLLKWIEDNRQN